ncbi:MAG: tetratricopeptide repeat protein, partial [Pseudomonadota bacterium]
MTLYQAAATALDDRQFDTALTLFEQVTEQADSPLEAWLNAAQLALSLNQPDRAESLLLAVR